MDVRDTVQSIMPSLMRIFHGTDRTGVHPAERRDVICEASDGVRKLCDQPRQQRFLAYARRVQGCAILELAC